jgi:hypothetical protein
MHDESHDHVESARRITLYFLHKKGNIVTWPQITFFFFCTRKQIAGKQETKLAHAYTLLGQGNAVVTMRV